MNDNEIRDILIDENEISNEKDQFEGMTEEEYNEYARELYEPNYKCKEKI